MQIILIECVLFARVGVRLALGRVFINVCLAKMGTYFSMGSA